MSTDRTDREVDDDVAACLRDWLARHDYVVADPDSIPIDWLLETLEDVDLVEQPHDARTREGRAWRASLALLRERIGAYRDASRVALMEHGDPT